MLPLFHLLAQIDPEKIQGTGEPVLVTEYSYGLTWLIAFLIVALIIGIAFKTSKRNAVELQ
jgi:hypothetical protein